jgi:hypothetical protein
MELPIPSFGLNLLQSIDEKILHLKPSCLAFGWAHTEHLTVRGQLTLLAND